MTDLLFEKLDHLRTINDICLFVTDFDRALQFYTEVFGLKCTSLRRGPNYGNYAEFSFYGTEVTLWSKDGINEILGDDYIHGNGGCFMGAVKLPNKELVNTLAEALQQRGANCLKAPTDYEFGFRATYFTDCENNIWEFFS